MRRTLTIAATALAAALMLVPAAAQASGSDNRASAADRNADRIPDRWERRHHLSLKVKQTRRDQDRDGLNNLGEFRSKTNPRDRDSDDDGIRDGAERRFGLSPRDDDSDDDGRDDGDENAGRVASFENGVLTIQLAAGGTISGRVVDGVTEIECRGTATAQASHDEGDDDGHGDDDGPSDNSGPGNAEDDHGNDEDEDGNCSSANLTPNTIVHEAELKIGDGGAVFDEVELLK